jgi:tetratricopeptide (TPR) repeat protein
VLTKYNIALYLIAFDRHEEAYMYFEELEQLSPENADLKFCKAFCLDQVAEEDNIAGYLKLVTAHPEAKKGFLHLLLFHLKLGENGLAVKTIEKYVSMFKDYEPEAVHNFWVAMNHMGINKEEKVLTYKRRLETLKDEQLVKEFFVFNKAVMTMRNRGEVEEAEFLFEGLLENSTNENLRLLSGINLIMLLEGRGKIRQCLKRLKDMIETYREKIDVKDFEAKFNTLLNKHNIKDISLTQTETKPYEREFLHKDYDYLKVLLSFKYSHLPVNKESLTRSRFSIGSNQKSLKVLINKFQKQTSIEESNVMVNDAFATNYLAELYKRVVKEVYGQSNIHLNLDTVDSWGRLTSFNSLPELSKPHIQEMLKLDPYNKHMLMNLCFILLRENAVEELKTNLLKVHRIDPVFMPKLVTFSLGQLFYNEKNYENAIYFFLENYKHEEHKVRCLVMLGKTFERMKDEKKALITYNKLSILYPNEVAGIYHVAKLFFKRGDIDLSEEKFAQIITIDPLNAKSHVYLARVLMQQKNKKSDEINAIIFHLNQGLEYIKENKKFELIIFRHFAELYDSIDSLDLAIKNYEQAMKLDPNSHQYYLARLSEVYLRKNKYVSALNTYLKLFKMDRENIEVISQIAMLYAYMSNYENAVKFFNFALTIEPTNYRANLMLGRLYREKFHQHGLALETFDKICLVVRCGDKDCNRNNCSQSICGRKKSATAYFEVGSLDSSDIL